MNDCSSAPPPTALRSAITPDFDSLESFLAAVDARVESILSDPALGEAQGAALLGSLVEHRQRRTNALADPLAMFYLLARAHDRPVGALGERVGAGLLLYFFALRLIDKVQDDELAGTPYAPLGRDVATNCGLTLFFLATHELRAAGTFAGSQATARALDELVHFHSLRSSRGQYLDLVGADEPLTPGEALALARMKSSVFSMFCEAAA
ncbi:MAG: hypothetical protein KC636_34925, partial [Myxococcales bacterium]|nr:hypothetical protein [Myxococcales bacterium]